MRIRIPQHVVYRSLVSETVMLNVLTGMYYGLNQTAGRMLDVLENGREIDAVVSELAIEFDVAPETIRQDLLNLCNDLALKGLVELDPAPLS
jgi:hypothetical protein